MYESPSPGTIVLPVAFQAFEASFQQHIHTATEDDCLAFMAFFMKMYRLAWGSQTAPENTAIFPTHLQPLTFNHDSLRAWRASGKEHEVEFFNNILNDERACARLPDIIIDLILSLRITYRKECEVKDGKALCLMLWLGLLPEFAPKMQKKNYNRCIHNGHEIIILNDDTSKNERIYTSMSIERVRFK